MNCSALPLVSLKIGHFFAFGVRFRLFSSLNRSLTVNGFSRISKRADIRKKFSCHFGRLFLILQRSYCLNEHHTGYPILKNEDEYYKFCDRIVNKTLSFCQPAKQLAYLPFATIKHRKEKYFVDYILPSWWDLMKDTLPHMYSKVLSSTIYNLEKINKSCYGGIIEHIQWTGVERMVKICLEDINNPHYGAKSFAMVLGSLEKLSRANKLNERQNLSDELKTSLSESFAIFFSNRVTNCADANDLSFQIGTILYNSTLLNFIKDPSEELKDVVDVCLTILNSNVLLRNLQCLSVWTRIATSFLRWNYNPGEEFYTKYFHAIEKTYDEYYDKERFCANSLKICFLIGLNFDENGFKRIHEFWTRKTSSIVQHWQKIEVEEIINTCVEKYNGNLIEIENILSKEIFDKLSSRIDLTKLQHGKLRTQKTQKIYGKFSKVGVFMDENYYHVLCNQLTENNSPSDLISSKILSQMPMSSLHYFDEKNFVENVFERWWTQFLKQLEDIPGYMLVHPVSALAKINYRLNGQLAAKCELLEEHPIEITTRFALKGTENERFTQKSFKSLLASVESFLLKSDKQTIIEDIAKSFSTFFNPEVFSRKRYNHYYYDGLGELLYYAKKFKVGRLSEECLDVIVKRCAKNFATNLRMLDNSSLVSHMWNILRFVEIFIIWNLDADKFYPNFWSLFFQHFEIYHSSLDSHKLENLLMTRLLKSILLITLKFDKENEVLFLTHIWQNEAREYLAYFDKENIREILTTAEKRNKTMLLENMVSKYIFINLKKELN